MYNFGLHVILLYIFAKISDINNKKALLTWQTKGFFPDGDGGIRTHEPRRAT